jgi:phytoene dehydrogenase-like protein
LPTTAHIIGSGPNGLAGAIVLAQAGLAVEVYEAQPTPGGACRTLPLTLPGFLHDFGSVVHPLAAGSPFFSSLPLADHGLNWIHGEAPLAHPLDDGTAVVLERNLDAAASEFGVDGDAWRKLVEPIAMHWESFAEDALGPVLRIPSHPIRMVRFALPAFTPAPSLARSRFNNPRTRALFAGLAAHSCLSFDQPLSSAISLVLAASAHAVGWPIPQGGAQAITNALVSYLETLSGNLLSSHCVDAEEFRALQASGALILCDTSPSQLLTLAGPALTPDTRNAYTRFQPGPGAFKVDYALSEPVPWKAKECSRAITIHLGGTFEEIATSELAVSQGRIPERPFVLAAQPTLFDPTRATAGKHTLWAYCHVPNNWKPNGTDIDMTARIESQIERFAPGFKDCILARHISSPEKLESMDANLIGGDIGGGANSLRQFLFRPSVRNYATGTSNLYLCSASTPPGGGVHGMCGYHAAKLALHRLMRT